MLSLGLLIPFGGPTAAERVTQIAVNLTSTVPAKHVTLIHDGLSEMVETRAADAEALLAERGLTRTPEDTLNVDPGSPLVDGETVVFQAAVTVTVVVDGQPRVLRSAASSVAALLDQQGIGWDVHDRVSPSPAAPLGNDLVVGVAHVERWTETVRVPVAAPVVRRFAFNLKPGVIKLLVAGRPGLKELRYTVSRTGDRRETRRALLVARVLRQPKARIIAEGVGEYTALSQLAERGIVGTLRLADSALAMIATAYTAHCSGCSGTTAIGMHAGHGIVAVDPRVIPLGTHMFIPGYGPAIAGDTGGAIRGRRIDLGFNSDAAAFRFGRRPVTVYLIR
jgi:3D (Asp-Asp-Asp) domain-containing protein